MTDLCAHPRLESVFYQTISLPGAAVDMVYWCPDCERTFADCLAEVEIEDEERFVFEVPF